MKQEDGKGIGDPVHKYYFFPSEARDFSRGYFTLQILQKQQMSDSRKRLKKQRNLNFPQRKKHKRFLMYI